MRRQSQILPMTLVLPRKPRRRATSTGRRASPENLVGLLLPRRLHVIHLTQFEVDRVPPVRVPPRLSVVVVAWHPDIQVAWRFGRREDGEQDRDRAPVREEVALVVVCPRVLAERVVPLQSLREREFVALGSQLAQPSMLPGRGRTGRCEQPSSR